jgi:hypothetical protein
MSPNSNITLATLKHYKETYCIKPRNSSIEAAKVLDCNNDTLRKSRSTGYLFGVPAPRHIKIGYTVKYTLEDLVQWLEESNKNESEAA